MPRILISGASSGLGRALALAYAQPGAHLLLWGRRLQALQDTAAQAAVQGASAEIFQVDVRDWAVVNQTAAQILDSGGPPDVLIANAGISVGTLGAMQEDIEVFRAIMDSNWLGTVQTIAAFLPAMLQANSGHIVGVASVAGMRGLPGAGAYSASKAATIAYLESLRLELHGSGIHVTTLCPGYIDTAMTQGNPYPMPWLMPVDAAARQMRRAIDRGKAFVIVPWPMALVAWVLKCLPISLYDRLFRNAPRKPRRSRTDR